MFPEFAYKFHAYQLSMSELKTARNELKNNVKMKYLLLHLYIFFVVILMFAFNDNLGILVMLTPLATLILSIFAFQRSFSKAIKIINNSIMYPYHALLLNSVESELIRIEKLLYRLYEKQVGRDSIRFYTSPKVPSYSDVISSHYNESIMCDYLKELYREQDKRIDMKCYINAIAKENKSEFMSKDSSVSIIKSNEETNNE